MTGQQEGEDVLEATDRDDGITVAIDAAEQTVTLAGPASVGRLPHRAARGPVLQPLRRRDRQPRGRGAGDRWAVRERPRLEDDHARGARAGGGRRPVITGVARVGAVLKRRR